MTRAADSKDLLAMVSFELPACSQECPDSFFIGMMAEEPVTVTPQLVASRVVSRLLHSSLQEHSQEVVPNLPASQRSFSLSSVWRYLFSFVALLCAANFVFRSDVNFKMYGFVFSALLALDNGEASLVHRLCHWTLDSLLPQQHLCQGELWEQRRI